MGLFSQDSAPARPARAPIPASAIDLALAAQLAVAWAGEGGEEPRLGWWRSDLTSEFGGEDLFRRLLPQTWRWATLQAAREVARRVDKELRGKDHDPDRLLSLFNLGFELDERVEERLQALKLAGQPPAEALPALADLITAPWSRGAFEDFLRGHGDAETVATPAGRRVKADLPSTLEAQVRLLLAALLPLPDAYPLPHFRRVP